MCNIKKQVASSIETLGFIELTVKPNEINDLDFFCPKHILSPYGDVNVRFVVMEGTEKIKVTLSQSTTRDINMTFQLHRHDLDDDAIGLLSWLRKPIQRYLAKSKFLNLQEFMKKTYPANDYCYDVEYRNNEVLFKLIKNNSLDCQYSGSEVENISKWLKNNDLVTNWTFQSNDVIVFYHCL